MGAFDDADAMSMCAGNDDKSCEWWLPYVVFDLSPEGQDVMRIGSILTARDPQFRRRVLSLGSPVGMVQGQSPVSAV